MVDQAPLYRSGDPDVDAYDEDINDRRIAAYKFRKSARTDIYSNNSVPLFLSDNDGEPDPGDYIAPPVKRRRASISAKILAGVCAAAAVAILVALFSSDATRDIAVSIKASMAAIFPAPSAAAQSEPSPRMTARDRQNDTARPSATDDRTVGVRSVATVAVSPAREEIKLAYQNALQGRAPAVAVPVAEPTTPAPVVHQLDPAAITALLSRAEALIASGDVAAARLVLRRAADAGDARAAMRLAETYDPAFLERLGVHGVVPDLAMARNWYEKARTFGSAEAPRRLETLASKRQ
jgi:TPR repeat protein